MPRIRPSTIWEAHRLHKALPLLLPECRAIPIALQELQWIRNELGDKKYKIWKSCRLRYHRYPLQYILGTQPFGPLEIDCRPGVLIPRWETEEWALDLAHRLPPDKNLQVLDLCTGTGCIPLLIKRLRPQFAVGAIECSPVAVKLASQNAEKLGIHIDICTEDVLKCPPLPHKVDFITCNPPYISRSSFVGDTAKSVQLFEPKLALIGSLEFYENLCDFWIHQIEAFAYEVGTLSQCRYVESRIAADPALREQWRVGTKKDSNNKERVVYGYKTISAKGIDWHTLFRGFGGPTC
ncbi:LADA_0E10022g1_1 [Lachancea dasiensis]|uniref:peptide chain release factor N(5)-glutamine methyltransferase n=1 Tax=Lachancea dasiensis TaxID=1072105 RepID=A0A1G4JDY9_9SACH|nr:LADA_0E10022g1_1 [Lachancea dasiensis]